MPRAVVVANGPKIVQLRSHLGLTQEDLAVASGYAKRTIERLESGERTRVVTLSEVARCLAVEVDCLIVPIAYELDDKTAQRIEQWVDAGFNEEQFLKAISMDELLAPKGSHGGLAHLTCEWSNGIREYRLRKNVTVAEFCAALREELFQGVATHRYLALGTSRWHLYDSALTVSAVQKSSGGKVKIYLGGGGLPLAIISGRAPTIEVALTNAAQGRNGLNARLCRAYLWLFDRAFFDKKWPALILGVVLGTVLRFVIADLNHLAWAYAESGTNIDSAGRMVNLILRVPSSLLSAPYFDTIAWVEYRRGRYSEARELLKKTGALTPYMYHWYFVLKALHDITAADAIRYHFQSNENNVWQLERVRVLSDNDTAIGDFKPGRWHIFIPYFFRFAFWSLIALVVIGPIFLEILRTRILLRR